MTLDRGMIGRQFGHNWEKSFDDGLWVEEKTDGGGDDDSVLPVELGEHVFECV